jgi:hypothetical protein
MLHDFRTQEGSEWVANADSVNYPYWSADSRSVYFDASNEAATNLVTVDPIRVTSAERIRCRSAASSTHRQTIWSAPYPCSHDSGISLFSKCFPMAQVL